ncbi:Hypothetical predicted protein [Mytilus galloprovincialis]|uniref:EB domain-containing protein n=1 Tax=Mytilus galloprovincialis TaxID=29158 RepID=A0A8B6EL93_MYTGA|nr:Hypothetical predicted protein [Mytilus galloprovincialis]
MIYLINFHLIINKTTDIVYIFHIEISNGAPCSETAQCTDTNAYCTENVCNCKAGYFEDATKENSCTVEEGVVGFCPDVRHTCYVENSECINTVCYCLHTHYRVNGEQCVSKKPNGAECTESYQCTDTQAECVDHLCTCKDGLFEDTNTNNATTCKEKYELGSTCSRDILDQCADDNAECRVDAFDTYKCLCKPTHYKIGNKCVPRIVENGECKHGGNEKQCLDTMVCKKVDGVYKCQYENESALGRSCTASTISDGSIDQCTVNDAECREDVDGIIKCLCKTTYYQSSNADCIPRKGLNEICIKNGSNLQCVEGTYCKMVDNEYQCKEEIENALGSSCTASTTNDGFNDQCTVHEAECREDIDGIIKCLCKTTHYQSSNDDCIPRKGLNEICIKNGSNLQCVEGTYCKMVDNVYKCQEEIENALGSSCTASTTNDGFNDQCTVPDAECREDIDGITKCLCKTTYYQSSNGDCIPRKGINELCIKNGSNLQCVDATYCKMVDNVYKCLGEMETYTGNKFTSTTEFSDPNTNCIENMCQCKHGFFKDTDTSICQPKIGLETSCPPKSTDQCADDNAECDKDDSGVFKCGCKTTHYNSNNQCLPRKAENEECDKGGHELQCFDNASCDLVNNVYKCNGANEMLPSLFCMILTILVLLH